MSVQNMAPQEQQPKSRPFSWHIWVTSAITIVVTLVLIGVVIWLITTQSLN